MIYLCAIATIYTVAFIVYQFVIIRIQEDNLEMNKDWIHHQTCREDQILTASQAYERGFLASSQGVKQ